MSQIEWFKQQHGFTNLDTDTIYFLLNAAHEEFNEQMIEKIIEQNHDVVSQMLKNDRQHLIPHTGTGLISPTIWEFAQERHEAKEFALVLEQHPIFPQLSIPHALKFCAAHKKNKRLTYVCNDFVGVLQASLNRTDGAACFLKVFENIPHYTNSFETTELLTKNLFSSLLRTNIFSPKRAMFFKEILNCQKFISAFEEFLINGFDLGAYKFSENDKGVFCPQSNTNIAHSISDLVARQGTHRQLIDLSHIDFEGVNQTMKNAHLAAEICSKMAKSPVVTDREYRQFFKKIIGTPNDKNHNTFAHYFVEQQINRTYSVNPRDVLKRLYTIFPEQRNMKNAKNHTPLDLLRHKISDDILEEHERQYLSKQLKKTVGSSNATHAARRKM